MTVDCCRHSTVDAQLDDRKRRSWGWGWGLGLELELAGEREIVHHALSSW